MTAPILRSAALQKALALPPLKRAPASATFASKLSQTQAQPNSNPTRASVAAQWTAASHLTAAIPPARAASAATPVGHIDSGDGAVPFKDLITGAARKYGLDPALLAGLVKQESNFNPGAHSGVGAKGLTQLMDATARGLGVTDSFDPAQSLDGGARFLSGLLKQFHGDQSLALAAYNAGPGAVQKYGGIPPYQETQRYVPKVLGYMAEFRRIWSDAIGTPATYPQSN
jgi:soluble lytic murein transglycosylase-like protein